MTDQGKNIDHQVDLDPFGNVLNEVGFGLNNIRFPGQYHDRETGNYYNWHRYYRNKIGRYYQVDPYFGFRFSQRYNYTENNPILLIDPFGLFSARDFWRHYRSGKKTPIDLADVGLLDKFRKASSVQKATSEFENLVPVALGVKAKDLCRNCNNGKQSATFSYSSTTKTDVTFTSLALFSVGRSAFYRTALCNITADCSLRYYYYFCALGYSISDKYTQPFNFRGVGPRKEVGTPYPITASWNVRVAGIEGF
jgi:RHS repeat-associated protein